MERRNFTLNLIPLPRFLNPKICIVDVTCPCLDICCPLPTGIPHFVGSNENRVMPLKNRKEFANSLRSLVGSRFEIQDFYLHVSGCFQVSIKLRGRMTRKEAKDSVKIAILQSGGFQKITDWMEKRDLHAKRINFSFGGVTPENIAYQ